MCLMFYFMNKVNFFIFMVMMEFFYFLVVMLIMIKFDLYLDFSMVITIIVLVLVDRLFMFFVLVKFINHYNLSLIIIKN